SFPETSRYRAGRKRSAEANQAEQVFTRRNEPTSPAVTASFEHVGAPPAAPAASGIATAATATAARPHALLTHPGVPMPPRRFQAPASGVPPPGRVLYGSHRAGLTARSSLLAAVGRGDADPPRSIPRAPQRPPLLARRGAARRG